MITQTRPAVPGWTVTQDGGPGPLMRQCLEAAIAAPSIFNSQPWRFRVGAAGVDVLVDRARAVKIIDEYGRERLISVGAAVFNLRVAMLSLGRTPVLRPLPDGPPAVRVAHVTPGRPVPVSDTAAALARAIPRRHSNRRPFAEVPVEPWVLDEVVEAARAEGAELTICDAVTREDVLDVVRFAEQRWRGDPRYLAELAWWTRWEYGRADGVPPEAHGPYAQAEGMPVRDFGLATPGRRRAVEPFERASSIAVLTTDADDPAAWLRAGQALQRVLLTATVRGLATTPFTQPLEIPALRRFVCGPGDPRFPQAIVRLGYGPPCAPSPRRPLHEVLVR
ncbi:nitroreductase family protein [Luedemannella flava]|uniref:Nitroreductase family protein n=1 Tax=Luedemannella flava TaxID=349316 RepID=A0ABP4XQ53_9ACTN